MKGCHGGCCEGGSMKGDAVDRSSMKVGFCEKGFHKRRVP